MRKSLVSLFASVIVLFCIGTATAQISVSVTNPTNTTPNLSNLGYTSLANAITALNNVTAMTGPVTFTMTAGTSETAPPTGLIIGSPSLNAVLSATNTVTFVKGSGAANTTLNAGVGTSTPGSAVPDGILAIVGADYITIDGLTLTDGNASNPATMEFGIGLFKASALDGASNNTIKNCNINLQIINNAAGTAPMVDGSAAIEVVNATNVAATTPLTITTAGGTNSNNKFYTNTINGCNVGIALIGFAGASPFTTCDTGNDIGGTSYAQGNIIYNFGGAAAATNPAAGIRTLAQYGINVSYNTLNNVNGVGGVPHVATLRGIYLNTAVSASETVDFNSIRVVSLGTTSILTGIENVAGGTAAGNTVDISSNTISNCTYASATSGAFTGITNSAACATLNMNTNLIFNNSTGATSGTTNLIQNTGAVTVAINMNNNTINGMTYLLATAGTLSCITCTGGAATCTTTIQSNNITGINYTALSTQANNYIVQTGVVAASIVNSNTFTNLNVNTSGTCTFISQTYTAGTSGMTKAVTNNSIVTAFVRGGASGGTIGVTDNGSSVTGTTSTVTGNNFSNVTINGTSTFIAINLTDGGTAPAKTVTGNTINNINGGTGTLTGVNITYLNGTSTISTNTITNFTGQGAITGMTFGASANNATLVTINGNIINNLVSNTTGGAILGIACSNTSTAINISNNTINTLSTIGASSVQGILVSGATNTSVLKNKIYDLSGSNASSTVSGVTVSAGTLVTVSNNLVGDLRAPNANAANPINGLNITGGTTVNGYYNSVYLNATSVGALFGTSAVSVSTTPTVTLRNNVFVNASSSTGAGLTVAYRRSTATLTSYSNNSNNNDFFAGTPSATNLIYYDGTTPVQTFPAYKTLMVTRDQASFTENPPFQSVTGSSANFLKFSTVIATQLESGGSNIATFTDDYTGTIRQGNPGYSGTGTAPDVGAWELNGIALDLSGPSITYTNLGNTNSLGDRVLTATLTDQTGVNVSASLRPRIYYRKNAGAYFSSQGSLASGTAQSGTWNFTIAAVDMGGVAPSDVIGYYVIAQDVVGPYISSNPGGVVASDVNTITTPPTPNTYTILSPPLSGDYTVGLALMRAIGMNIVMESRIRTVTREIPVESESTPVKGIEKVKDMTAFPVLEKGKTVLKEVQETYYIPMLNGKEYTGSLYHEFTNAERNQLGLSPDMSGVYATVTAAIADANLRGVGGATRFLLTDPSYSEAGTMTINVPGVSALNTFTIKPQVGIVPTISVNSTSPIFVINSSFTIIDGSNTVGGLSRDLTLINNGVTTASSGGIFVGSANAVSSTMIRSCVIKTSGSTIAYGIVFNSGDGNSAISNTITKTNLGIQAQGSFGSGTNITIGANSIGDAVDRIGNKGIVILATTGFTVTGNVVTEINNALSVNCDGIFTGLSGTNAINGTINENRISNIVNTSGSGYGGHGIWIGSGASCNINVYNNAVSGILGSGDNITSTLDIYDPAGIIVTSSTSGVNIYYNSIYMSGQNAAYSPSSGWTGSSCILIDTLCSGIDMRNNALRNDETSLSASYIPYLVIAKGTPLVPSFNVLNYNLYYENTGIANQQFGRYFGIDYATFTAWKAGSGVIEGTSSTYADPGFTSTTNLAINASSPLAWNVNGMGQPLALVGVDLLETPRSTTVVTGSTDIGAYNVTPSTAPATATASGAPAVNTTTTYTLNGRTLCTIAWGPAGTPPSSVNLTYFPGTNPPNAGAFKVSNAYWVITVPDGSGYSYDITFIYDDSQIGTIVPEASIRLAKATTPAIGYTPYIVAGTGAGQYALNTVSNNITVYGLTGFSTFTLTDQAAPLPVELASFTSSTDHRNVSLNWSTVSEHNNTGFDIERKLVGPTNSFSKVGFVAGAGNSNISKSYSFNERNVESGKYNYRLKQMDNNGNFHYYDLSNEVIVGIPTKFELSQNYPNPFNPSTKINYDLPVDSKVSIVLFDMTGKQVANIFNANQSAGYQTVSFNASNLASGAYFYQITATGGSQSFTKTMKMMLVK